MKKSELEDALRNYIFKKGVYDALVAGEVSLPRILDMAAKDIFLDRMEIKSPCESGLVRMALRDLHDRGSFMFDPE